jgi:hypothetical protein
LAILSVFSLSAVTGALGTSTVPEENTWTTKTPMPTARAYPGVAAVNGKIYAIGCDVGSIIAEGVNAEYLFTGNVTNVNEEYDPVIDNNQASTHLSFFGSCELF